ncbi:zinc finger and SCAN domain-containing protein 2-like [Phyllopteryx taeniolatus]|uniref:zinc finger and SCAN domain-containing protein 2-like n=1 Tax=Phyllopteryx taeniolatus TaxID=161469 RepID=UPI002AD41DCE|nr:zinc finger and SCAN domain-containing protein 2-like [Phyllopteryx taeniolatus]
MCKVETLRALLNERLSAAVEEIVVVFERTIAEYEEELCRTKEENERQRQLLDAVLKSQVGLHKESSGEECLPSEQQALLSRLEPQEPKAPHVKEEEEEGKVDITKLPLTGVSLKADDEGEEEGDGGHCGGSQADNLLAPLSHSEDIMSHSPETDDEEYSKSDMTCHDDKKHWKCSQCGKTFYYRCALIKHNIIHTGEKPFMCSVCGKGFAHKGSLTTHTRTHTGEKPYSCSICNNRFTCSSALVKHMRRHTGEKPFRCSVCGKRYTRNENLKVHARTHTGEKPFLCLVCNKSFNSPSSFVQHRRTHTGEKPFSCLVCNKSFNSHSSFARHRSTHSGEIQ